MHVVHEHSNRKHSPLLLWWLASSYILGPALSRTTLSNVHRLCSESYPWNILTSVTWGRHNLIVASSPLQSNILAFKLVSKHALAGLMREHRFKKSYSFTFRQLHSLLSYLVPKCRNSSSLRCPVRLHGTVCLNFKSAGSSIFFVSSRVLVLLNWTR